MLKAKEPFSVLKRALRLVWIVSEEDNMVFRDLTKHFLTKTAELSILLQISKVRAVMPSAMLRSCCQYGWNPRWRTRH